MTDLEVAKAALAVSESIPGAILLDHLRENYYNVVPYAPQNNPPFNTNDVLFYEGMRALFEVIQDLVKAGKAGQDNPQHANSNLYL